MNHRARAAAGPRVPDKNKEGSESKSKTPDLAEFLEKRDWSGAITLLEYKRQGSSHDVSNLEWLAYCYFHAGDPGKALETYRDLLRLESDPDPTCQGWSRHAFFTSGATKRRRRRRYAARIPNYRLAFCSIAHIN